MVVLADRAAESPKLFADEVAGHTARDLPRSRRAVCSCSFVSSWDFGRLAEFGL